MNVKKGMDIGRVCLEAATRTYALASASVCFCLWASTALFQYSATRSTGRVRLLDVSPPLELLDISKRVAPPFYIKQQQQ